MISLIKKIFLMKTADAFTPDGIYRCSYVYKLHICQMSRFAVRPADLTRIWHVVLWVFRETDALSTSEDLFLEDYKTGPQSRKNNM